MSKIDIEFKNALNVLKKNLPNTKTMKYTVEEFLDSEDILEDYDIGENSMFREEVSSDIRDYINGLVENNTDMVWKDLCKEFGDNFDTISYITPREMNILKMCCGYNFETIKQSNSHVADELKSTIFDLIVNEYVDEQGGWFDQIMDVYYNVFITELEKVQSDMN